MTMLAIVGKIVLWILIVLAVLLVIAIIRALLLKAPAKEQRMAVSRNEKELQEMGERFARMIRVETISKNGDEDLSAFDQLHDVIDELFPLCTKTMEKNVVHGVLIYRWKGKDSSALPILMMGHQDVVPVDPSGWKYPPFGGEIHDGALYGRGTMDDKCNIFCQMSAIEGLLAKGFVPPCDVYLSYSINEETSGNGAKEAIDWLKAHGVNRLALALDEGGAVVDKAMAGMDRPYAVIGITEKGYVNLKVTASGEGGHASAPKAETPVTRLCEFVSDVNRKQPFERVMTPHVQSMFEGMAPSFDFGMKLLMGNLWLFRPLLVKLMPKVNNQAGALLGTTCAFTMMKGSDAANVIPSHASMVANLRTGFTQNVEESVNVLKKIGAKYDLEFEVLYSREASPVTPTDSAAYKYLEGCIRHQFPDCGVAPYVMTGGTDNRWYAELTENCLRFYPVRLTSEELSCMHGNNERISLDACSDAIDFYAYFLEHYQPGK